MNNVVNFLKKMLKFGVLIPASNLILTYGYKYISVEKRRKISDFRTKKIQKYLTPIIDKVTQNRAIDCGERLTDPTIWVCWLQGEDNMPIIPQICLNSIRANANGRKIVVLTADNYSQYVTIPEHIVTAYKLGKLKHAHFADIIRMNILAQRGGLWLDATMLVTRQIPDAVFEYPFFSIKTKEEDAYVSRCRWAVFCLGQWRHNALLSIVSEAFSEYLKQTTIFIDYFMFDQFIDILYQKEAAVREWIDSIPMNNEQTHRMSISKKFEKNELERLTSDTYLFKLSWKGNDLQQLESDKENIYNYLKGLYLKRVL